MYYENYRSKKQAAVTRIGVDRWKNGNEQVLEMKVKVQNWSNSEVEL
jgi:hypothetical protein